MKSLLVIPENIIEGKLFKSKFIKKKMFLSPGHDRVVTIESRNFSIAKDWCCRGFCIDLLEVVIWQHIHPFTLLLF